MKVKITLILLLFCFALGNSAFSQTVVYQNSSCSGSGTTPKPAFTNAADIECGYKINFDGSTSQDNSGNYNLVFDWDFSYNGTFDKEASGMVKSFEFPGCGDYVVALRVTDNDVSGVCKTSIVYNTITVVDKINPWFKDFPMDKNNNQPCASYPILRFNNPYTQVPGFGNNNGKPEQGEKFRFPFVTPDLDVLVSIVSIVNVKLDDLDLNDAEPNAFKPSTSWFFVNKHDRGYVEFLFEFVETGTTIPYVLDNFVANFNDIDGQNKFSEQNWTQNPTTYTVNNPTELDLNFNEFGWILATGPDFSYPGGLSNNVRANLTTTHNSTSSFRFRVGGVAFKDNALSNGSRLHNITFACLANYENPETFTSDITVGCDEIPPLGLLEAEDNCGGPVTVTVDEVKTPGTCAYNYTLKRTWTATDPCGNIGQRSQTIHVEDKEMPTFKVPSNVTIKCFTDLSNTNLTGLPDDVQDGCSDTNKIMLTYSDAVSAGSCVNKATVTRTWRLEDECGNVTTKNQIIIVNDDEAPTFDKPDDITLTCFSSDTSVTGMPKNISDNCSSGLSATYTDKTVAGPCDANYGIERTWSVKDECGNETKKIQVIKILDESPPTLIGVPANTTVECSSVPSVPVVSATDNCDNAPVITFSKTNTSGTCAGSYTITRTWTATDACGNATTASQVITVKDTTAPVLAGIPGDITVECNAIPAAASPTATDNCCTASITYSELKKDESCANSYKLIRTWTTSDDCGNTSKASQTITVIDSTAPTFNEILPADVTVNANAIPVADILTASDNCGTATVTFNDVENGSYCDASHSIQRTWIATDACGLTTSHTQTITVLHPVLDVKINKVVNILCSSEAIGSIDITVTNGTAPYTYLWNNSATTQDISNVIAGTYSVTVTDAKGCTSEVSTNILFNCTHAIIDINNTFVNLPVNGNVLTNDFDLEGDAQTVTTTTVVTAQGVTVNIDPNTGIYTYTPPTDFVGQDSFEYTICDNGNPQACDSATVYIEVIPRGSPGNQAPIANADTNITEIDTPINGNVLSNDFDPDNDPITVTTPTVVTTQGVTVNIDPNTGAYTYTPPAGFTGEDTFMYTICDNGNPALCDTAMVVITVIQGNQNITVANDDAFNTPIDVALNGNVLDNDSDPEGDTQTVSTTPVVNVNNGTLVLNSDGTFVYTPNSGFEGTDSFVYTVCDNGTPMACDTATVYITVGGFANSTHAITDINNTFVNLPVNGNVLTNDFDLEGDTQTVTTTTVVTAQGVTVNIDPNTGAYTYTPPNDYIGQDSFEYTICDNGSPQACDSATVYIEVIPTGGPGNKAPIANADTNITEIDTPINGNVLSNDFDPDNDPITITTPTVVTTQGVTVNIDPNTGAYTYTPPAGFTGEDTFMYTICDNGNPALCDTAMVVITVIQGNQNITVANDDAFNTPIDVALNGNVLDNDSDPEGDTQTVSTTPVVNVNNGTLVLNSDGTFVYTPNSGFEGTDSFVYTVCDNGTPMACDTATVYITVGGFANSTHAITDINNTFVNLPVNGNVLTNDFDLEGDTQTVTTTTVVTAQGVTVNIDPNTGFYTYTPPNDFVGQDSFEYTICDNGSPQACDSATVYIEVIPTGGPGNKAPIANADTNITEIDTPINGNVLSNDFDPDNDPITVTTPTVLTTQGVTVNIDPNTGAYTYTPPAGFTGEDTFMYTICDNGNPALCDTAMVVITVIQGNKNITVANDDAYLANNCTSISENVLDNDSDPEGDTQTVSTTPVVNVNNGTLVLNSDGTFLYTPNSGFEGTDSFVYTVCDNGTPMACDTATVYLSIIDTTPPDVSSCSVTNLNIECSGADTETIANQWNADNIAALEACAIDGCDTDLSGQVTSDYAFTNLITTCGTGGTISVIYTIADDSGNSVTLNAILTIEDTIAPAAPNAPDDITYQCINDVPNAVELTATDDCYGDVSATGVDTKNDTDPCNVIITRTWTFTDGCSNSSSISQTITVSDTIAPELMSNLDTDLNVSCSNIPVVPSLEFADNCSTNVNVDYSETNSLDTNTPTNYEIIRTWTVNDHCGNEVVYNQTLHVTLEDIVTQVNDRKCIDDGIIDLNNYLSNNETGGTWKIIEGTATLDMNNFDPENVDLGNYKFTYTAVVNSCLSTTEVTIEIHDECVVYPCGREDVVISKVITPNGDSYNEFFTITGIELCDFVIELQIFNRWGAKIYENFNYKNDWNGKAHNSSVGNAEKVPNGTYFYIINLKNSGLKSFAKAFYVGTK